ncbi:alpha/beta hydrolase [Tsukamurella sp. NPDC003166]|uniref:alpha/beta hydrolase n=1 Tax=Tsukamurella sp. NPDC003166 TaxID=3154444 RepID=UPI0033A6091E
MSTPAAEARLGAGRYIESAEIPAGTITTAHELATADGAKVYGILRTLRGARTVVSLMHPRQDLSHHVLVPELLARGFAVWTQGTRSTNNDLSLIHEQALLDAAAGQVFLRDQGFENLATLGHSGGGTLYAFYHQQAGLAPADRLRKAPSGRPVDLTVADMPVPDAAVFMAPHPGQGALLQRLIDPSVADESDPLSVVPDLDPYSAANGFAAPGTPSSYSPEFIARYRAAQAERIARIDAEAASRVASADEARARFKASQDPADRRASLAPRVLTVYRTDADLRFVDPSIDPNERPYGSLFGRRPDLTNYGLVGFGRLVTPDAWMSTWSANTTNADFLRCAPGVRAPTLFVELTGDAACFPADATAMVGALGAADKEHRRVAGTHFGGPIRAGAPTGASLAAAEIGGWLAERFGA